MNGSNRGHDQDRDAPREIQRDRSPEFERPESFAKPPEIEFESPTNRQADARTAKSFESDMDLLPQDGWEFDDSSSKN